MSYQSRIEGIRNHASNYAEVRPFIYFRNAAKIQTADEVARADKSAQRDIEDLEQLIADLKEYRQALTARYSQLETMSYHDRLELQRVPNYGRGVVFYVRTRRIYEDGTETELKYQRFDGKQRREAIKYFEDLKRERPGIEAVKDIEKKSWER